ncbi:hypothetical protein [Undibacterium sp.]|uniref:hypothetical protein n=1 Tax=Undibacterium sp. TaxID=1914977 RepID=UPI00273146B3|nr:hypothetical protein [Undibacterium sp.]MDP1978967.1 hypothetical protein [Undibacterium sp.]
MPIQWKSRNRFKPELVLERIDGVRTVGDDGGVSYTGFEVYESMFTLQSMLQFPTVAAEIEKETLIWRALSITGKSLTPDAFLKALNCALDEKLKGRETEYIALTSMSLDPEGLPKKIKILNCDIEFLTNGYPKKFSSRDQLIKEHRISVEDTPKNYCKILVKIKAKSDSVAFHKAMRAIDLLRAILCLMANPTMQLAFKSQNQDPINVIRLGCRHTVHLSDGTSSRNGLWYEPNFMPTRLHKFENAKIVVSNFRWILRLINKSNFQESLITALLLFVRALDHSSPDTAFLRLWSALETLTSPGVADYDKLIHRSAFLFKEHAYHRQVLEHLRVYRNANVHAGEESQNARIHCFQLQLYFTEIAWFCIRNSTKFSTLDEAGQFLDLSPDPVELQRCLAKIKRAIKFTSPK